MGTLDKLYRHSLALLTDQYQLTMAYGYWKAGIHEHDAVFNMHFRHNPFGGGYSICCGLEYVIEYLQGLRFDDDDLSFLDGLTGNDGQRLFDPGFLDYLRGFRFTCDIDAIPEGTAVFPHEPLVRVRGPIIQGQIVETPILNLVNFQTLIATKASRICLAAAGEPVIEFGLRRSQGVDGGLAAARAAYVGGVAATSNVLAAKLFGIPVRGTHAHSWVMAFSSEAAAFQAYAEAMPNNCVFLVDTYASLEGVRLAVEAGRWLREQGHEMVGVRLDSGDLAYLSVKSRKILDQAGFEQAVIVASNDLDEHVIASLKQQGATIGVWGVGTRLVTAHDEPALGGVYKLSAVRPPGGEWRHTLKVSEQVAKITNPGMLQVRRYSSREEFAADMIYDEGSGIADPPMIVDPGDMTRRKRLDPTLASEDLLVPVFRAGRLVYQAPELAQTRQRAQDQLARFHPGIKRFVNPHAYPVGLEKGLHELKTRLVLEARGYAG